MIKKFLKFNIELISFKILSNVFFGALIISYFSCASTGTPSGGKKDVNPPKLDSLKSEKNFQVNFEKKDIVFYFNEFVEVKDAIKQVLVSPPLTFIPKVESRGKKVTFKFNEKEILRDEVTYTINFGDAIVDFTEGNKLQNFYFVFATGDQLDSLTFEGKVIDVVSNKPIENFQIFLYNTYEDSIVVKEKPYYSTKTDKNGNFIFRNIKSDTFKLFGLNDLNVNFRYDLDTEMIAFPDSLLVLTDSTEVKNLVLYASIPTPKIKLLTKNLKTFGKVNLLFNTNPKDLNIDIAPKNILFYKEIVGDSINIFYETDLDSFFVNLPNDTIVVKALKKEDFLKKSKFIKVKSNESFNMLSTDSIQIDFNFPIASIIKDSIFIQDTIGVLADVDIFLSSSNKSIIAKYNWRPDMLYTVKIDSGLVKDIYGRGTDSISLNFKVLPKNKLANINLEISTLDSLSNYLILIKRGDRIIKQFTHIGSSSFSKIITNVLPDAYKIEIIQDINKNGIWDSASYWNKTQAEKIKIFETEKIKENRDTDVIIEWSDVSNDSSKKEISPGTEIKK